MFFDWEGVDAKPLWDIACKGAMEDRMRSPMLDNREPLDLDLAPIVSSAVATDELIRVAKLCPDMDE